MSPKIKKQMQKLSWIKSNPRLSFLLVGLGAGFALALFVAHSANSSLESYKSMAESIITEYKTEQKTLVAKYNAVREENRKLSSSTKTYKLIKPDGTIEERTQSDVESEEQVSSTIRAEYEKKSFLSEQKIVKQYEEKLSAKRQYKLQWAIGYTTDYDYYTQLSYPVFGSILVGGMATSTGTFGISFGIGL